MKNSLTINQITTRRAVLTEGNMILEMMENQFIEHNIKFESNEPENAIREMFSRPEFGFLNIAVLDREVVGFSAISFAWTLEVGGKTAWLDELNVQPAYRTRGVIIC